MLKVYVNGVLREFDEALSLEGLLTEDKLLGRRIAVEVNEEIVPHSQFSAVALCDGDKVEIVHAIGGG